jgi:hypothetical protein
MYHSAFGGKRYSVLSNNIGYETLWEYCVYYVLVKQQNFQSFVVAEI